MGRSWLSHLRSCGSLVLALSTVTVLDGCRTRSFNKGSQLNSARPQDPGNCGNPGQPGRPNPAHCNGPFQLDGDFVFNEAQVSSAGWAGSDYSGRPLIPGLFGTTTLFGPDRKAFANPRTGKPKVIRDLHYHLGNGRVGMRAIPIALNVPERSTEPYSGRPTEAVVPGAPEPVRGSEILDRLLRSFYYGDAAAAQSNLPVWAIGANLYPGRTLVQASELAEVKSENSIGHSMVYIGGGWSRHSPMGLHDNQWTVSDVEPTTIIAVKLKGQKPDVVNKNLRMVSRILNELNGGPQFPPDYTFDPVRVYNLQAALMFFAKWIEGGDAVRVLKESPEWGIYCAEFMTLALNLGINVPLTETYFDRIWPNGYGKKLWQKLLTRLPELGQDPLFAREMQGDPKAQMPNESFVPLWELSGIREPAKSTQPSAGFAWPLETTADLVHGFLENFATWADTDPVFPTAATVGFAERASERVGVELEQYMRLVLPAIVPMYMFHFQTPASLKGIDAQGQETSLSDWPTYVNNKMEWVKKAGVPAEFVDQVLKPQLLQAGGAVASSPRNLDTETAYAQFQQAIKPALEAARKFIPPLSISQQVKYRNMQVEKVQQLLAEAQRKGNQREVAFYQTVLKYQCNQTFVRFNAPPHLAFRVAQGVRESNPNVEVQAIGTLFKADLLKYKPGGMTYLPEDLAPRQLPADVPPPAKNWDPAVFAGEGGEVCGR